MSLQEHYDAMRASAFHHLAQGEADLDTLLDSKQDDRRGITLLTRPPRHITEIIEILLADFQRDEPAQYYYPPADIHLTILSIIACYSGFSLDLMNAADYRKLVGTIVQRSRPFSIRFSGLTASPGGIIVQGFPLDDSLQNLRDTTRKLFQESGLPQSIDQRYSIQTAHSTVIRFKNRLLDPSRLLKKLAHYQRYFIGSFEVNTLELVYNDWYQRQATTVLLESYSLRPDGRALVAV